MDIPPLPDAFNLPPATVIAIPAAGLTAYRLTRSSRPSEVDFRPSSQARASLAGWPEILRCGVSMFTTVADARNVRLRRMSRIAAVTLLPGKGVHVARTGRTPGHLTVWASPGALIGALEMVPEIP